MHDFITITPIGHLANGHYLHNQLPIRISILLCYQYLSDGIFIRCEDKVNHAGCAGGIDQGYIDAHTEVLILTGMFAE